MIEKIWNRLIFQLDSRLGYKCFMLGVNLNYNRDYGYSECYLCLYLGFWNLFIGFRGKRKDLG